MAVRRHFHTIKLRYLWGLGKFTGFLQDISPFDKGSVCKSEKSDSMYRPDILLNGKERKQLQANINSNILNLEYKKKIRIISMTASEENQ